MIAARLVVAARSAEAWLLTLDPHTLDSNSSDLYRLAEMLCRADSRDRIVRLQRHRRLRRPFDCSSLVDLRRRTLLTVLNSLALARPPKMIDSPSFAGSVLGMLALSYSWTGDVNVVAAIVRTAGRLLCRHPFLDQAANYLLDQQSENGAFGLLACGENDSSFNRAVVAAQLKTTVDVLWAIASYQAKRK